MSERQPDLSHMLQGDMLSGRVYVRAAGDGGWVEVGHTDDPFPFPATSGDVPERLTISVPINDGTPLDPNPDLCWRCDARVAANDLGLCEPCREALT